MRLTDYEVKSICRLFKDYFGKEAHLWLFGSRVDDTEILIFTLSPLNLIPIFYLTQKEYVNALERAIGDRHVDVIIKSEGEGTELPIYQIARETGIQLV